MFENADTENRENKYERATDVQVLGLHLETLVNETDLAEQLSGRLNLAEKEVHELFYGLKPVPVWQLAIILEDIESKDDNATLTVSYAVLHDILEKAQKNNISVIPAPSEEENTANINRMILDRVSNLFDCINGYNANEANSERNRSQMFAALCRDVGIHSDSFIDPHFNEWSIDMLERLAQKLGVPANTLMSHEYYTHGELRDFTADVSQQEH
ncbi:MAG: hypothetical protein ACI92I_000462 [Acidimicrobiales bacterium]|jgi:hypothetical protein